jgi:hypothetical protein
MAGLPMPASRRRRPWVALGLAGAALAVLAVDGLQRAESNDQWCTACHLPPEATFVARAAAPTAVDLASAHARVAAMAAAPGGRGPPLRCIDCHGGPGLAGRWLRLRIAARDFASWLGGQLVVVGSRYVPVESVHYPPADSLCAACHAEPVGRAGFENHFHNLLDDPAAPAQLACVSCHDGHRARPGEPYFLTAESVAPGCEACHLRMGGPGR